MVSMATSIVTSQFKVGGFGIYRLKMELEVQFGSVSCSETVVVFYVNTLTPRPHFLQQQYAAEPVAFQFGAQVNGLEAR